MIIDASMPNVVRDSGMMWNKEDALEDVKCMIPDRSYARIYQASQRALHPPTLTPIYQAG